MPDFIDLTIQHEGLEPFQTPFKITSEAMRGWDTIHGFKIDKKIKPSKGRENFIYLENQENLKPAVRQQFINYATKPESFEGLKGKKNITVADAVRVFDQTGAEGKLKFLQQKGIDTNMLLNDLLGEGGYSMVKSALKQMRTTNAR